MPRIKITDLPHDLDLISRKKMKQFARGAVARDATSLMRYHEAKWKAEAFVRRIQSECKKVEIVGSIRRGKAKVNDIDIVAIPKDHQRFLCGVQAYSRNPAVILFVFEGAKIDLFLATPENYEVSKLMRTGSILFNEKLCLEARKKGWEMDFTKGLVTYKGIIRSEAEILRTLLGRVLEPSERE